MTTEGTMKILYEYLDETDNYQHTCKSLPASIKKLEEFMNSSEYQLLINQDSFLEEKIKNKQQKINKKINYDEKSNLIIKKKKLSTKFLFSSIKLKEFIIKNY